ANKVNIAVRESFRDADVVYFQAADDYKVEKYQNAAILFTEAEARFAVAGRETEEKRQRAADTIRMADEKITAVERSFEGGSR
ncbi:MAG: hypothetical protein LBB81_02155, partial [Treponema sp.]|nr:hypothetical protein [Treponema sp.]